MKFIHAFLASLLALGAGEAAAYPDKPVQYIIPFAPGGESDITARMQAVVFQAKYKQQMIVLNKPGAGGGLVWSTLNAMPADGSIIAGVNLPHIVLQPLEGNVNYKTDDVAPVCFFQYTADAQKVWAQAGFRPVDPAVGAEFRDQFPVPVKLWTIADLGGWATVDPQLFDKSAGSITKIYTKATG